MLQNPKLFEQPSCMVKNPSASAGDGTDVSSIPGSGRFPEIGNGNTLQYSCLKSSMNTGAYI